MSQNETDQTAETAEESAAAEAPEISGETEAAGPAAEQEPAEEVEAGAQDAQDEEGQKEDDDGEAGGSSDEGDIAADYLEELLDIVDLDGDIDIEVRGERTFLSVVAEEGGDELNDLVGRKGEVLDALQELTRLAVLTATGSRTRLVLDVAGHRERRQTKLKQQADDAVAEVNEHGNDVHLEPMSAYERKIVHDFVAEAGLISESEGEGKRRHVVVSPT